MEAEISLNYDDSRTAKAVAQAVSADNIMVPKGMTITTQQKRLKVVTKMTLDGEMTTLIATIDDLLFCVSTAEKALRTARKSAAL